MPLHHIGIAVFVMMLWGGNFVAIKMGLQDFPPLLFSALRFILTAFPLIFLLGKRDAPWKVILLIGVVLGIAKFSLLFIGMDIGVSAGIASLVLQTQALFTVIIAAITLRERPEGHEWGGLFVAFLGVGLIAYGMSGFNSLFGLCLVLVAGVCWAIANLLMKRAGDVNMLKLVVYMSLVPPIPLLILSFSFEGTERISLALGNLKMAGVLALLYVVVVATLFGFAVWGFLLRKYSATKVAPFALLVPVFGMTLSALILGEKYSSVQIIGAISVIAGLVFINKTLFLPKARVLPASSKG